MRHDDIVPAWEALGTRLEVDGANSRIWREGKGEPVVCLHGVPASSFVYRKLLPELATHGMEGIAFDFPGMGLADRPAPGDVGDDGPVDLGPIGLLDRHRRAVISRLRSRRRYA